MFPPALFWASLQISMNVLPWWVYVEMDDVWTALEGSVVTVSQVTLLLRTRPDAEVRNVWITCDWTVFHVSMQVLEMFHLHCASLVPCKLKTMLCVQIDLMNLTSSQKHLVFGTNESIFSPYRLRCFFFPFHGAFVWLSIKECMTDFFYICLIKFP